MLAPVVTYVFTPAFNLHLRLAKDIKTFTSAFTSAFAKEYLILMKKLVRIIPLKNITMH